jgi:hypothetical protein
VEKMSRDHCQSESFKGLWDYREEGYMNTNTLESNFEATANEKDPKADATNILAPQSREAEHYVTETVSRDTPHDDH